MPCHPARAKELVKKGKAIGRFSNSIYYIKLLNRSEGDIQTISCGIDPGSKREAITVKTKNHTLINILAKARDGIKESLETRKNMRRNRRQRKTPYRKNKYNRNIHKSRIPPSTKARWNSKLRIINILKKLYPIEVYVFEDISAKTLKGKRNWNKNFSPLQIGKNYFISELEKLGKVIIKQGFETFELRKQLGLEKSKKKLDKIFSAHNVDSWVLANSIFNIQLSPDNTSLYYFEHIEVHRRQLHYFQFAKGGIRKRYGGTISLGIPKGSVVKILYKKKYILSYIGGNTKGRYTIHSLENGERLLRYVKFQDIEIYPGWIAKWKVKKFNKEVNYEDQRRLHQQ
jgi:hypothetical protein